MNKIVLNVHLLGKAGGRMLAALGFDKPEELPRNHPALVRVVEQLWPAKEAPRSSKLSPTPRVVVIEGEEFVVECHPDPVGGLGYEFWESITLPSSNLWHRLQPQPELTPEQEQLLRCASTYEAKIDEILEDEYGKRRELLDDEEPAPSP